MKPDKRTKAKIIEDEHKFRVRATITIILLSFFLVLILTAKFSPPPCTVVKEIVVPENFCLYTYAHLRNTTSTVEYFWIEYKENMYGPTAETQPTTSLDQLTTDARNLYLNQKITLDQYHCLLAGIKGHELKGK